MGGASRKTKEGKKRAKQKGREKPEEEVWSVSPSAGAGRSRVGRCGRLPPPRSRFSRPVPAAVGAPRSRRWVLLLPGGGVWVGVPRVSRGSSLAEGGRARTSGAVNQVGAAVSYLIPNSTGYFWHRPVLPSVPVWMPGGVITYN